MCGFCRCSVSDFIRTQISKLPKGILLRVISKPHINTRRKFFWFFSFKKRTKIAPSLRHCFIEMQSIEVAFEVVEQIGFCRAAEKLHTARIVQTICKNSL